MSEIEIPTIPLQLLFVMVVKVEVAESNRKSWSGEEQIISPINYDYIITCSKSESGMRAEWIIYVWKNKSEWSSRKQVFWRKLIAGCVYYEFATHTRQASDCGPWRPLPAYRLGTFEKRRNMMCFKANAFTHTMTSYSGRGIVSGLAEEECEGGIKRVLMSIGGSGRGSYMAEAFESQCWAEHWELSGEGNLHSYENLNLDGGSMGRKHE